MEKEITLTIALPNKVYLEKKVPSVIIPAVRAEVDILSDRAPSVFALDFGLLQVLDTDGSVKEKYFIQSGMAEIAANKCRLMIQGIVPFVEVNLYEAKKRVESAENEQERLFYQMILDYQRGIRRRYLRTLNLFSDKSGMKKTYDEVMSDIKHEIGELRKRNEDELKAEKGEN